MFTKKSTWWWQIVLLNSLLIIGSVCNANRRKAKIISPDANTRSPKGKFLFMASVELFGLHICGGTVLNRWMILTAKHCMTFFPENYTVRAGSVDLESGGQVVNVKKIIPHPNYEKTKINYTGSFDAAILELEKPLEFSNGTVEPIKLSNKYSWSSTNQSSLTDGIIIGWGYITTIGPISEWLRNATVPILNSNQCDETYNANSTARGILCAGDIKNGGIDSCVFDSGGPLLLKSNGEQIGIISSGDGCALPGFPGIYVNVTQIRDWIDKTVRTSHYERKLKLTT